MKKGYTLIEVIIAMLLLTILLLGGTALFYQNLKSSGLSDVDSNMNSVLNLLLSTINKDIRYSQVDRVGSGVRSDCMSAGILGYSGNTLHVIDLQGLDTTYSLENYRVASTSGLNGGKVFISPENIKINDLKFTWFCRGSVSDKINIEVDASSTVLGVGLDVTRKVSSEVNLLNSGVN